MKRARRFQAPTVFAFRVPNPSNAFAEVRMSRYLLSGLLFALAPAVTTISLWARPAEIRQSLRRLSGGHDAKPDMEGSNSRDHRDGTQRGSRPIAERRDTGPP